MNEVTKIKPGRQEDASAEPVGKTGLAIAMANAFAAIEGATKSATNPHFKSKYADLGAVIEAVKPALIANGLFFTQRTEPVEKGVQVETVLHHTSGAEMSLGKLYVPANKQDAQGFGSALTYARRYALVTAFGVPVEDDDGNAAVKGGQEPEQKISDTEWSELSTLIQATNTDTRAFCQAYGIESVKALPKSAFGKAKAQLNRKLQNMEGDNG